MIAKFSETVQRWMGWCPNAATAGHRYTLPVDESGVDATTGGTREVAQGALVDHGLTGTLATYSILLVAGALFFGCLFLLYPPGNLLLLAAALIFSALEVYRLFVRSRIEITHDTISIRRPPFPPITIPKDTIVEVEVQENNLPAFSRLLVVALGAFLVAVLLQISIGFENPTSMRFISSVAAVILFPVLIYRTYLRSRYPRALAITTMKKRIAVIYTDAPERIARALEGRSG
ncbi:MAG: DUF1673 family protein [Methanomicrobiales archaeon]|nr:DUF1673 family protein [Methanomicrobiales archaeon]